MFCDRLRACRIARGFTLQETADALAAKVYEQTSKEANQDNPTETTNDDKKDDVQEANFEEK